ncbi:cupin domain-containing protein [Tropicibacter naphthalenivorans]|uniref:Cupin domain protein n=1 Tax=Tropicibacter naphthalenivorans TaxID=441103 RepID=A0A0P1H384_9RHOB|nr:cupin domain-containing protein [Tropicibacter naphthalenivorans]CUH82190.1 Cupin domain protein [Tropicibacter naphthalenivorans]SMD04955.1 Cupin domain-containing protein [Tropicibacter naphthalenivorans]
MSAQKALPEVHRVVTGHDASGKAVVLSDGAPPHVTRPPHQPGLAFHELWNTAATPAPVDFTESEPTDRHRDTAPPKGGTVIRFVDIPPEGRDGPEFDRATAKEVFRAVGLGENARYTIPGRHPLMHRTESIDYGIVLSGRITLLLDEDAVELSPGDVVVQRGTIHAWANRSDEVCRMAFILTDGAFAPELAQAQSAHDAAVQASAIPPKTD